MSFFRRLFYGWVMVGLSAGIMVIGTVPIFQGMSAWNVVLQKEFGWSRTELALAFTLSRVEGSIMGPISGYLIDKLGPRQNVFIGMTIAGGGFLIFSWMDQLWHFYTAFVVISVGVGLGTWMPMMTVLNNWFNRRRATAMALAMEGFQVGGVLLVPVLVWAIDPDVPGRLGWRNTALILGIFMMAVAWPLSRMVKNTPEEAGQHPDGDAPLATVSAGTVRPAENGGPDYTWQQAVRTKTFWLITLGHACSSIVIVSVMVHLGPLLTDRGFSLATVGWIISVYTAVGAVFTLIGGYVGDRVPLRLAIFGFSSIQTLALAVLLLWDSLYMAYMFGILMGVGFGGRTPLTTAIRGVYFGRRAFASITGVSMIPMNLLLLAAPLYAGIAFDRTGSYFLPFATIAIMNLIGSAMFLLLGSPQAAESSRQTAPAAQTSQAD